MAKKPKKQAGLSMGGIMPRGPGLSTENKSVPQAAKQKLDDTEGKVEKVEKKEKGKLKKKRKSIFSLFFSILRFIQNKLLYLAVSLFVAGLYLFKIDNLPPLSADDSDFIGKYNNFTDIGSIDYLPGKLIAVVVSGININPALLERFVSAAILLLSFVCFYKLTASWISRRMSLAALLLFSASGWVLFQGRADIASALLLGSVPISLYLGRAFIKTGSVIIRTGCLLLLLHLVFVPGALWIVIGSISIFFAYLQQSIRPKTLILPVLAVLPVVAGYGVVIENLQLNNYYTQVLKLLGLELGQLPSMGVIKANVLDLPGQLFFSGVKDNSLWMQHTPIIDVVSGIFLLCGLIYLARTKVHPIRKKILFSFLALALALVFLNGFTYVSILLPVMYLFIALGVTYLTDQWLAIFPNNPLARWFGIALVFAIVFMVSGYHIEKYFIAWPRTSAYQRIFNQ
jgi:hypothetical protein